MVIFSGMMMVELDEWFYQYFISEKDQIDLNGFGVVYLMEVIVLGQFGCWVDVVYIGLWYLCGVGIVEVCELKVSWVDWFKELKEFKKVEVWWLYCNIFWFVVLYEGIVWDGELFKGWGLMMFGMCGCCFKVLVKLEECEVQIILGLFIILLKNMEIIWMNFLCWLEQELWKKFYEQEQQVWCQCGIFNDKDKRCLEFLEWLEKVFGMELVDYVWEGWLELEGVVQVFFDLVQGWVVLDKVKERVEFVVREMDWVVKVVWEMVDCLCKEMGI